MGSDVPQILIGECVANVIFSFHYAAKKQAQVRKHLRNQADSMWDILHHQGKLPKQSEWADTIPAPGTAHRCPLEYVTQLNMNGLRWEGWPFPCIYFFSSYVALQQ